jgi:hypothetical protein
MRGFTLPEKGCMFVFDYDEVFRITLAAVPSVETLDGNPYDFEDKHPDYFGVSEREPILQAGDFRLSYSFDPTAPSQEVVIESPQKRETVSFKTFSGDWFVATLSPCARFLILAEPFLIEIYSLQ